MDSEKKTHVPVKLAGLARLQQMLFGGDRELLNIKFFATPGSKVKPDQFSEVVAKALKPIIEGKELVDNPPLSGRKPMTIDEAF